MSRIVGLRFSGTEAPAVDGGNSGEKTLDKMTVAELEAFAAERGIDLGEAKNKGEKLAAIMKALEGGAEGARETEAPAGAGGSGGE